MREIVIGAAQMGPIQRADTREAVVARMLALLDQAAAQGCQLVVFPELCLTTFFPRHLLEGADLDHWYETEMPGAATTPLFERAKAHRIAISFGYAELTPEGRRFNTSLL
ncbi:MAG: nitrilase-related carbon-nitrogen hydrolase, partial [Pseudomonadota bacterium]